MNSSVKNTSGLANHYGEDFYAEQMEGSYRSAKIYVDYMLENLFRPTSVVDLGCGRGTWLKAFKDAGVERVVGLDGEWNSQANMVDSAIVFKGIDLNAVRSFEDDERFDMAMSLECAEHLEASSAANFVECLTRLSDAVVFGAAYPKQGGSNHVNEQPASYWANLFSACGYVPYDVFRPALWGNDQVEFWYRQNTFLYVKSGSVVASLLAERGYSCIRNVAFMDCVHPELFNARTQPVSILKAFFVSVIPAPLLPMVRKIKNLIT